MEAWPTLGEMKDTQKNRLGKPLAVANNNQKQPAAQTDSGGDDSSKENKEAVSGEDEQRTPKRKRE